MAETKNKATAVGPLMLDLEGTELTAEEQGILENPLVGGIILFSRNYENREQLRDLIKSIRKCNSDILIAVDHEGGRVQRFREDFSHIPPMAQLGKLYRVDKQLALISAKELAWLLAMELRVEDIDFSFAPVLDLEYGNSEVIGDRAFSDSVDPIIEISKSFIEGFREAGMASTGKHFPGHGFVTADSHVDIPRDPRSFDQIIHQDGLIFESLCSDHMDAVMPAHVIYDAVDQNPAGFSSFWLKEVLRSRFEFEGVIFSDDLAMEGATIAGDYSARAKAALSAGCDMVLVCNNPEGARSVLGFLDDFYLNMPEIDRLKSSERLSAMRPAPCDLDIETLRNHSRWMRGQEILDQVKNYG